jgi:hypothetical protein
VIDEINEHEEETVKRVDNFQELANGSTNHTNSSDQHAMDFNTGSSGGFDRKQDPVSNN